MSKLRDAVKAKASAVVTKTREVISKVAARVRKNRITTSVVKATRIVVDIIAAAALAVGTVIVAAVVLAVVAVVIVIDTVVTIVHKIVTLVYILASALLGLVRDRTLFRDEMDHARVVLTHWSAASYLEANAIILARDTTEPAVHVVKVRRRGHRISFEGPEAVGA